MADSILDQDPRGRLDIAICRGAETLLRAPIERACGGLPVWNAGLGRVVEAVVTESLGVPNTPIDPVEVARGLGLLPAARPAKKGGR